MEVEGKDCGSLLCLFFFLGRWWELGKGGGGEVDGGGEGREGAYSRNGEIRQKKGAEKEKVKECEEKAKEG